MKYTQNKRLRSFLNRIQQKDRDSNILKNIVASFLVKGVSIVTQLIVVPLTIGYVNTSQYGIWLTLSSIVAWFSFFDMGFGNGLRNRFAEASATGNISKARVYISTTYICLGVIFSIVWVLFVGINFVIDWSIILNAPEEMAKELSLVALIVFAFFCLQVVFKTISTILIADQKPAKSALFDMIGQVLALLVIFILTKTTQGSLLYLALVVGFCPLFILIIASIWLFSHQYSLFRPSLALFDKGIVKDIMGLGSKFFFIQFAAIIIFQTNNIVITQICGSESVTIYNVVYKLFMTVFMIFQVVLAPFWSAFTDAYTKGENEWMKDKIKNLEKIWIILSVFALVLLLCSPRMFTMWLGDKVVIPNVISIVMCVYFILYMRVGMYIAPINGIGKIKLQLFVNLILSVLNIFVVIFLGKQYGLFGIVIGNILMLLPLIVLSPIQLNKLVEGKAKGIWNQ